MKAVESSDRQKFFIDLDSARSESKSSLVEQRARENAQVSNSKIEILDGSNSIDPKKCVSVQTHILLESFERQNFEHWNGRKHCFRVDGRIQQQQQY